VLEGCRKRLARIRLRSLVRLILVIAICVVASAAHASFEATRIPTQHLPEGTPGLGGGMRLPRDVYVGQEGDPDLVPLYLYDGKWLYSNGTAAGLHFYDNDRFFFNLGVRYRFNKLDPDDYEEIPNGIANRRQTVEGGFATGIRGRAGILKAEWGYDLLGRHDGHQLDLTYRYPFKWGNFQLSPFVTFSWLDDNLANYYYGVSMEESQATGIDAYDVGGTENFSIGFNSLWQITDHIFVFGNVGFDTLNTDIQNSPLVEKGVEATAYVGAGYFFGPVKNSKYVDPENVGEWSLRLNYGYTGEHNITPEPMQGTFIGSKDIDTNIFGITVGKLLQNGKRVSIYGKFALFRHLEEPYQDDFWNYTAYVIAIGKGYFPWSDKVAFRWGFGMGASYAQSVPMIEQIKQANRDRNTSKFLNYLEWMVDFPIDAVIPSKIVRNCFAGVTVVHRSGIFSTSDILGDVAGGADWYTVHIECLR
jgi:outer membrane protein